MIAHGPLHARIADALRDEIRARYTPGERLPPERALADRFAVNRHTLRQAIAGLVARGELEVRRGRGVFVAEPAVDYPLTAATRFSATIAAAGRVPRTRVLVATVEPADEIAAARLGLRVGDGVVRCESLRSVDGRPFSASTHRLPAARCAGIVEAWREGSLHDALEQRLGLRVVRAETVVGAILCDADDALTLQTRAGAPLLLVDALNCDRASGKPIEWAVARMRGERARLRVAHDGDDR